MSKDNKFSDYNMFQPEVDNEKLKQEKKSNIVDVGLSAIKDIERSLHHATLPEGRGTKSNYNNSPVLISLNEFAKIFSQPPYVAIVQNSENGDLYLSTPNRQKNIPELIKTFVKYVQTSSENNKLALYDQMYKSNNILIKKKYEQYCDDQAIDSDSEENFKEFIKQDSSLDTSRVERSLLVRLEESIKSGHSTFKTVVDRKNKPHVEMVGLEEILNNFPNTTNFDVGLASDKGQDPATCAVCSSEISALKKVRNLEINVSAMATQNIPPGSFIVSNNIKNSSYPELHLAFLLEITNTIKSNVRIIESSISENSELTKKAIDENNLLSKSSSGSGVDKIGMNKRFIKELEEQNQRLESALLGCRVLSENINNAIQQISQGIIELTPQKEVKHLFDKRKELLEERSKIINASGLKEKISEIPQLVEKAKSTIDNSKAEKLKISNQIIQIDNFLDKLSQSRGMLDSKQNALTDAIANLNQFDESVKKLKGSGTKGGGDKSNKGSRGGQQPNRQSFLNVVNEKQKLFDAEQEKFNKKAPKYSNSKSSPQEDRLKFIEDQKKLDNTIKRAQGQLNVLNKISELESSIISCNENLPIKYRRKKLDLFQQVVESDTVEMPEIKSSTETTKLKTSGSKEKIADTQTLGVETTNLKNTSKDNVETVVNTAKKDEQYKSGDQQTKENKDTITKDQDQSQDAKKVLVKDPIPNIDLDLQNVFNRSSDQAYWLQDKDIRSVLQSKKEEGKFPKEKVNDCIILPVFEGVENVKDANDAMRTDVKKQIQSLKSGENLVGLANHGGHWTAFKISKEADDKLSCQFMDSLSNKEQEFKDDLEKLKTSDPSTKARIDEQINKLENGKSEIFLIENIIYKVSKDEEGKALYQFLDKPLFGMNSYRDFQETLTANGLATVTDKSSNGLPNHESIDDLQIGESISGIVASNSINSEGYKSKTAYKISKDWNGELSCVVMDNSNSTISNYEQFQQAIEKLGVGVSKDQIIDLSSKCNKQTDGSACGLFALENAEVLASNENLNDITIDNTFSQDKVKDIRIIYGDIYAKQAVLSTAQGLINNLEGQRSFDFSQEENKLNDLMIQAISGIGPKTEVGIKTGRVSKLDSKEKGDFQYTITIKNSSESIKKVVSFLKDELGVEAEPDRDEKNNKCTFYIPRDHIKEEGLKKLIIAKNQEIRETMQSKKLKDIKIQIVENNELVGPYDSKLYSKDGIKELTVDDLSKTDSAILKIKKEFIKESLVHADNQSLSDKAITLISNISLSLDGSSLKAHMLSLQKPSGIQVSTKKVSQDSNIDAADSLVLSSNVKNETLQTSGYEIKRKENLNAQEVEGPVEKLKSALKSNNQENKTNTLSNTDQLLMAKLGKDELAELEKIGSGLQPHLCTETTASAIKNDARPRSNSLPNKPSFQALVAASATKNDARPRSNSLPNKPSFQRD